MLTEREATATVEVLSHARQPLSVSTMCLAATSLQAVRQAVSDRCYRPGAEIPAYVTREAEVRGRVKELMPWQSVWIIDFDTQRELAVQSAQALSQALQGNGAIIAISERSEANLIVEAMRSGCSEYLTKPFQPRELCEAIERLPIYGQQAKNRNGKAFALIGCRGGAGTTTLAVHIGTFLAGASERVLIVDQHPCLGHVALYLGQDSGKYDFYELVRNVDRLDESLLTGFVAHHSSGLDVLASPGSLGIAANLPYEAVQNTVRFLSGAYDYVVLDCPTGLGDINLATIDCCDEVYLVATPDVPALRDLSRYVDRLIQCNVDPAKFRIVVNRFSSDGAVTLDQISKAVRQPVAITVPNNSAELIRAMNTGTPIPPERKSEFTLQITKWTSTLTGKTPASHSKKKFAIFGR